MSQQDAERQPRFIDASSVPPASPQEVRQQSDFIVPEVGNRSPLIYQTLADADQCIRIPFDLEPIREKFMTPDHKVGIRPAENGVIAQISIMSAIPGATGLESADHLSFNTLQDDIDNKKLGMVARMDIYVDTAASPIDPDIVDTAIFLNPRLTADIDIPTDRLGVHKYHEYLRELESRVVIIGNHGNGDETHEPDLINRYVATFRPKDQKDLPFASVTADPDNSGATVVHKDMADFRQVMNKSRQPAGFFIIEEDELVVCGYAKIMGIKPGTAPKSTCTVVTTMSELAAPKRKYPTPRSEALGKYIAAAITDYIPQKALGTGADITAATSKLYSRDGSLVEEDSSTANNGQVSDNLIKEVVDDVGTYRPRDSFTADEDFELNSTRSRGLLSKVHGLRKR